MCGVIFGLDFDLVFDFCMSGRSLTCEGIYKSIMSKGVSGLLVILKTCRYNAILFGVGIVVMFFGGVYVFVDHG